MSGRAAFGLAIVVLLVAGCGRDRPIDAPAVATNNRGVGLMGMFRYEEARALFDELAAEHPDWLDVRVNLAIAILNRQEEGDEARALEILQGALARAPEHLRARYCTGLLLLRAGDESALDHLSFVAERDPGDPYALYFHGSALERVGRRDEALARYRQAIEIDPYLRSAYYRAFQLLLRAGDRDGGMALNEVFLRLEANPRAHTVDFFHTKMGSKAEALAVDLPSPPTPPPAPRGDLFAAARPLLPGADEGWKVPEIGRSASVTAADIDGDGDLDLFLGAVLAANRATRNAVLINRGDGTFDLDADHPLAGVPDVYAALWGDWDNDGRTDVYLCRRGENRLYRRTGAPAPGNWQDVTASTGTAGGDRTTVDGALVDADHDGDLDIFCVNADGPNELFNNNRDGTFRPIATEQGLAGYGAPSRQVHFCDLDGDRDLDIVVVNEEPPHEVYRNDRLWSYEPLSELSDFASSRVRALVSGDADADGQVELYTLDSGGAIHLWRRSPGGWSGEVLHRPEAKSGPALRPLALLDVSGDGAPELLAATTDGWLVVSARPGEGVVEHVTAGESVRLAGLAPVLLEILDGPSVVGVGRGGGALIWPPGPGRYGFAALAFSGVEDPGKSMRSNASGIGVRCAVRVDSRWTIATTTRDTSGPGQSLQPLAIGLGGADHLDFVAIDWPDGVFQSEVHGQATRPDPRLRDFSAGRLEVIGETDRQPTSCPVLFAFDGEGFAFVSDLLGVGGMGYLVAPGEYAPPRPWENFLLPGGLPVAHQGQYQLKLAEPMEEACYLDRVGLVAWDLPPGWRMTLDERMGILGPEPTGAAVFYRQEVQPAGALNDRGESVILEVLEADGIAAPVGPLDHRFLGRLAREHVLILAFAEPIDAPGKSPVLVADGWIEYPYSQTMFAAWQAGADYKAPTLEARAGNGPWQVVSEQFGYPAGMPRQMSLPLADLPPGTTGLRLRTNQEIYWDRLRVVYAEPCPEARRHELTLAEATVRRSGFARRTTGPQRRPFYDYDDRPPFSDTRHQAGLYTAFGPALELVAAHDDAMAIFGPGEEIHLAFEVSRDALPPGWRRELVLQTRGWCKDMDLFTADGETVGPLPSSAPRPDAALHERYNTRYESGR